MLPITPDQALKPDASDTEPVIDILKLLAQTVGIPFMILAASGPLLQSWFSELYPGRSPFRLYAVSNIGSLLALLTYPFLFEVYFPVSQQSMFWSAGFVTYALALAVAASLFARNRISPSPEASQASFESGPAQRTTAFHRLLWISFSACGSILLLAITSQLGEDVAVIPFLWVVPLALYLLTFVIAFDHSRWYSRKFAISASVLAVGLMIVQMNGHYSPAGSWSIPWQVVTFCAALFFTCLVCHGEIVRLKPPARFLTEFYLLISVGGALGGVFVSLVAPHIFTGYWELHFGLVLLAFLITLQLIPTLKTRGSIAAVWIVVLVGMIWGLNRNVVLSKSGVIASSRGFFGVLNVREQQIPGSHTFRSLYHGKTIHGLQFKTPSHEKMGTAYYHYRSGVGRAFEFLHQRQAGGSDNNNNNKSLHVGLLGLGIGTLATYAQPGDRFRCYEINHGVVDLARSHFTYLKNSQGEIDIILGDGRISMERELHAGKANRYDLLVIDAFSGHAPPIHLLTQEALELYFAHLKEDGILALHISNGEIDFSDPIRNHAARSGMQALQVIHQPEGGIPSIWALVTRNEDFAQHLDQSGQLTPWARPKPKKVVWTDDFNSLLQALRYRATSPITRFHFPHFAHP
ncbi:spermidine synthase [Phragmitibacter flavus]|nr:hypothetical protein [Phragmitibacter flavus]